MALADEGDVLSHVVGVFQQRMFRPTSSLDGTIVTQLGIMAAELGNSETLEVSGHSSDVVLIGLSLKGFESFNGRGIRSSCYSLSNVILK